MRRLLRLWLMCLLALALPVQGGIAATMLPCGPAGDVVEHAGAGAAVEAAQHHHAGHDEAAAPAAHTAPGHGHDTATGHDAGSTCAACATCAAACASLPATVPGYTSAPAPESFDRASDARVGGITLLGLERPPRGTV